MSQNPAALCNQPLHRIHRRRSRCVTVVCFNLLWLGLFWLIPSRLFAAPRLLPLASTNMAVLHAPDADIYAARPARSAVTGTTGVTVTLPLTNTTNILLLGSDRRPVTPNWRTDVIMIIALDFAQDQAGVISIPRDVYLDAIPNHQPNRINVVDYLGEQDTPNGGGPALMARVIAERMDIRIDHYLRFDFDSFRAVVDALDGVTIEIDCPYLDDGDKNAILDLQPGSVHLNGAEALRYVRSRRQGGDLDRVRRQQRFVWAVRNQMLGDGMLQRIPTLYRALKDAIQTDIGIVNMVRIVRFTLAVDETDIHGVVLTPPSLLTPGWRSGMSIFLPDWSAIRLSVQDIFERPAFVETNTPQYCP